MAFFLSSPIYSRLKDFEPQTIRTEINVQDSSKLLQENLNDVCCDNWEIFSVMSDIPKKSCN